MNERGEEGARGPIRVLVVIGTRPEAIKLAPLIRWMRADAGFEPRVCLTAQHRELLDEPLELFGIRPDHDLDLMRAGQDPLGLCARALPGLGAVIQQERPEVVLVQGDTTTAFAGAWAAVHHQVRLGHVEAGLRTGRKDEPFPEESNRRVIGALADDHFAPTPEAAANLLREGVPDEDVIVSGNTIVDAVREVATFPLDPADRVATDPRRRLILLTSHRREHHGEVQRGIFRAVRRVVESIPDVEVVFPVHPNPQVVKAAEEVLSGLERVHRLPPIRYRTFVDLLQRSTLVLTDSGGVQEEAPSVPVPVLVLRRATERSEGVTAGGALLVGTDEQHIADTAIGLLNDAARLDSMRLARNPYGDGQACRRIADFLRCRLRGHPAAVAPPRGPE